MGKRDIENVERPFVALLQHIRYGPAPPCSRHTKGDVTGTPDSPDRGV